MTNFIYLSPNFPANHWNFCNKLKENGIKDEDINWSNYYQKASLNARATDIPLEIVEDDGFAFDHAEIILRAYLSLKARTAQSGRIVFDLMPELFTLNTLQEAHEIILGEKLLTPNFRRKMAPYVIETDAMVTGAGHRPAKLFRRNLEAFYNMGN